MELSEQLRQIAKSKKDSASIWDTWESDGWERLANEASKLEDELTMLQRGICGTNAELSKAWDKIEVLEAKADSLQALAHEYIQAYEKLAFGDALQHDCEWKRGYDRMERRMNEAITLSAALKRKKEMWRREWNLVAEIVERQESENATFKRELLQWESLYGKYPGGPALLSTPEPESIPPDEHIVG